MDEQEQQNQQDSFLKQQGNKAKEKLKDDMKKNAKKGLIKLFKVLPLQAKIVIIAIIAAIGILLFLAMSFYVVDDNKEGKTNAAAATAVSTTYSVNASTTGTDEDGNEVNKVAIALNANKTGYEIVYNNDTDYIEGVRDKLEDGIVDSASDFTDFELAVLGALMENGADLDYFTEDELHCLPAFIKVEACTQNLDLRPNSEKESGKNVGDYIENYEPKKVKDLAENEVPGVILVQRTNTNGTKTTLEYIDESTFNENLRTQKKENVINYFTINDKGEIVYAKWDNTNIKITGGEYPENLPETKKDKEIDEDFIVPDKIPYVDLVKQYTMPFEFLVQLLVITEEPDFCMELVDYALDSKIVIDIQEEETVTVTTEDKTYDMYYKEEKRIDYEIVPNVETKTNYLIRTKNGDVIIDDSQTDCTVDEDGVECTIVNHKQSIEPVTVTTTKTEHTYKWEIIEADNWLAKYTKDYETGYDISKEKIETTPIKDEIVEDLGQYEPAEQNVVTTSEEILKDVHVEPFKQEKEEYYKDKVAVPEVSVEDGYDVENAKYIYWKKINIKELNTKFVTSLPSIETKYERVETRDREGETIYIYYMPSEFTVTTKDTGDLIGDITYEYDLKDDYTYSLVNTNEDDVVKCNISKLSITPYNKINTTTVTNQKVTKYPANDNPIKKTEIYLVDSNGNFRKFLKAYDNSQGAQNQLNSIDSWLFEMMEENENTVELVDKVKYLLYEYDGVDRGVTKLEGFEEMFEPESFASAFSGGIVVKTDETGALPSLTREQVQQVIEKRFSGQAKQNLLDALDGIMYIQDKHHVNAIFAIAVTQKESSCGTNWGAIDASTYNWCSVTGSYNGNSYTDGKGRKWRKYNSFDEAIRDFGALIANDGEYFRENRYTINSIAIDGGYCEPPEEWIKYVSQFVTEMYESIGISVYSSAGNDEQQKVVEIASNSTKYGIEAAEGYCQAWVANVYFKAGANKSKMSAHCAVHAGSKWGASTDWNQIQLGATVYGYGSQTYGHVGIYIGDGMVAHNIGGVAYDDLNDWIKEYKGICWGWNGETDLTGGSFPCESGLMTPSH